MLPVEQQAKLGVSAEESKTQRLKRQQARFRDRGGAFVPSNSNPLVNILLSRTVSGESPSKAPPKRPSLSKARRSSLARKAGAAAVAEENQPVAGSSKTKLPTSRKRAPKAVKPEADAATKPATKRRGRPAKSKKIAPDPGSDTEKPSPPNTKPTPKGKGKQSINSTAPSTSDPNTKKKPKPKPKAKIKSNPAKGVVEVVVSDDDQTLVEVPHKARSNPKTNIQNENDGETDDDVPVVTKWTIPPAAGSKASGTKPAKRVKTERIPSKANSGKKTLEDGEKRRRGEGYTKTNAKKRLVPPDDDDDDDVVPPPAKKAKVAKSKNAIEPEPEPHTTGDAKNDQTLIATGKGKGKARIDLNRDIVVEEENQRPSKPKKRKKEEDNYNDRPRKAVKFAETGPPHSSSQKLKENQSSRKQKSAAKASVEEEPDPPRPKLAAELPARTKTSKGPPRDVLERIKASAARYLQCADSEPDELDCLS